MPSDDQIDKDSGDLELIHQARQDLADHVKQYVLDVEGFERRNIRRVNLSNPDAALKIAVRQTVALEYIGEQIRILNAIQRVKVSQLSYKCN